MLDGYHWPKGMVAKRCATCAYKANIPWRRPIFEFSPASAHQYQPFPTVCCSAFPCPVQGGPKSDG
eukprot:3127294-Amphidinium_carterae.1